MTDSIGTLQPLKKKIGKRLKRENKKTLIQRGKFTFKITLFKGLKIRERPQEMGVYGGGARQTALENREDEGKIPDRQR